MKVSELHDSLANLSDDEFTKIVKDSYESTKKMQSWYDEINNYIANLSNAEICRIVTEIIETEKTGEWKKAIKSIDSILDAVHKKSTMMLGLDYAETEQVILLEAAKRFCNEHSHQV